MDLTRPLLLDGATGTELARRGAPGGVCTERWVLEHPEVLVALQREYVAAGSDILAAPTFGANPLSLSRHGIAAQEVEDYNRRLLALSRRAAGDRAMVAADLSPAGAFLAPYGEMTFEEMAENYASQARALTDADLFLLETFTTLPELRAAMLAVRAVSDKPIVVSVTSDRTGHLLSGTEVPAALLTAECLGAAAVGLNCSEGPELVLEQLTRYAPYAKVPLLCKPNAGLPRMENGAPVYPCTPEELASYVPRFAALGARLFGGCCGSTPAHIAALRAAVDALEPSPLPEREENALCTDERTLRPVTSDDLPARSTPGTELEDALEELDPGECLWVSIDGAEDLEVFRENQYAIRGALCLSAASPELLESALRSFQGRACCRAGCVGEDVARAYGALIL